MAASGQGGDAAPPRASGQGGDAAPLRASERADDPRVVVSEGRAELARAWLPVLVLAALAAPLTWRFLLDPAGRSSPWALAAVLLLLVLLTSLGYAVRRTLAWRRYGRLELELDPVPGSLGGHVGGYVRLPLSWSDRPGLTASLSCVRVEIRGTGNRKRRWESLVWRREMEPRMDPATGGLKVRFTFPVPVDLPASEPVSEAYHVWKVRLRGSVPGVDLDRAFAVPVRRTPEPLTARDPALPPEDAAPARDRLRAGPIRMEPEPDGVSLRYGTRRDVKSGTGLSVFGLLCAGVPALIWRLEGARGSWWGFDLFGLLFGGVFLLVGLLMLALGLYLLFNTLHVRLSADRLRSVRRFLPLPFLPFRKEARTREVDRVEATIRGQIGQGAEAEPIYEIRAFLRGGGHVVLGDGIHGIELADRLLGAIRETTGLQGTIVPRGSWSLRERKAKAGSGT